MNDNSYNIDLSKYKNALGFQNQIYRFIWTLTWGLFARPLPRNIGRQWKLLLLRLFGAKIHSSASIYSSAKIYMPSNLIMRENSCIAENVDCYNVAPVIIGANVTISQKSYLCTASHDITDKSHPLITAPIIIEDQSWVAADAFIGMGVTIGQGAVVGARAAVFKNIPSWTIVGGNPARFLKKRELKS